MSAEDLHILLETIFLIAVLIALPAILLILWICVIVFAVKLCRTPKDNTQRRAKLKKILKRFLIVAIVMTLSLTALLIVFSIGVMNSM